MSSTGTPSSDPREESSPQLSMLSPSEFDMHGLDPANPFSFLVGTLDNSAPAADSSSTSSSGEDAASPPDWSQFSHLLSTLDSLPPKFADPGTMDMDFGALGGMGMGMEHDFDGSLAIEPSALHFDSDKIFAMDPSTMYAGEQTPALAFPYSAPPSQLLSTAAQQQQQQQQQPPPHFPLSVPAERRLSITSSSSSSGASLSPVVEHSATVPSACGAEQQKDPYSATVPIAGSTPAAISAEQQNDPAHELAQRVRQVAGVTLAVPMQGHAQQFQAFAEGQKVAIPRLPRPTAPVPNRTPSSTKVPSVASADGVSSASSPAAPSTAASSPSPSGPSTTAPLAPGTTVGTSGRPKTSHTTIERRYRTNLNARIQSLKNAVPALRVLDLKKKDEASEGAAGERWADIVDERGYADGVKVARKISKANVLGKATEYIRVLKRREARLKREQDGLRSLIGGLVGGPALLREWEREWATKFGGPERDEIDGVAGLSDDEDGEGEDSEDDEDGGRARKKAKVAKTAAKKTAAKAGTAAPAGAAAVPEKRKRGRPRKVIAPPAPGEAGVGAFALQGEFRPIAEATQDVKMEAPGEAARPQQYLLAAFALFSFFNSPFTSPPPPQTHAHHTHSGTVLTPAPQEGAASFEWRDVAQVSHLLVSALLLVSIVLPWLPRTLRFRRLTSFVPAPVLALVRAGVVVAPTAAAVRTPTRARSKSDAFNRVALIDALSPACRGTVDEAGRLRAALGVHSGLVGLVQGLLRGGKRSGRGIERMQLEQRAWVRLGELAALDDATPVGTRLQAYWGMVTHTSVFCASATDLATLALIVRPFARGKAAGLWAKAAHTRLVRPFERLVLAGLDVDGAAARLGRAGGLPGAGRLSPLGVLAELELGARMRRHAAALFVRAVLGAEEDAEADAEDEARRATVEAGKALGGRMGVLAGLLERVAAGAFVRAEEAGTGAAGSGDDEAQTRTLLGALVLFRRLFPATGRTPMLSPPPSPSPSGGNARMHTALRVALDADVFEGGLAGGLEDARDRVVDMLVEADRAGRARRA